MIFSGLPPPPQSVSCEKEDLGNIDSNNACSLLRRTQNRTNCFPDLKVQFKSLAAEVRNRRNTLIIRLMGAELGITFPIEQF